MYLEDSFVLNIKAEVNYVEFLLEVVLTENHPLYVPPSSQERYCYKKAKLRFSNAKQITWIKKQMYFLQMLIMKLTTEILMNFLKRKITFILVEIGKNLQL